MSTPITFSGFNDIDFSVVLNALMTQASQPLTSLQSRQTALKSQLTTFDTLRTRIDTLKSAASALGSLDSVSATAGTSSDSTAVGVSSGPAARPGHYDVVVTSLARAQVTASTQTFADADTTVVANGGSITIGGVAVALSGDTTLTGLAAAINGTTGIGVTASVVNTAPGAYRLALTSTLSGTANAFSVTNNLTGGSGITFGANAVNASDAAITINNIAATSSSNVFADVVPGVTLTVLRAAPGTTIGVDVTPDGSAFAAKVESFVTAYNDVIGFLEAQRTSAGTGDSKSIGNDPLLRQLRSSLRSELIGLHGSGTFGHLSEVGVEFRRDGKLELNRATFDAALASNGDEVRSLFAGTGGVFTTVDSMLDSYTQTTGLISSVKDRLNKQIATMDGQILSLQNRLALQRDSLQRQFTEADAAMSRLKNQSGALSSIGSF
jgi:flagellar hook-associated protein 2